MNNDTARKQAEASFKPKAQQCRHPGCRTLTLNRLCQRHEIPPAEGAWIIAAQVKAETAKGGR